MKFTEKELEILEILEKDSRLPVDTIAKMVELESDTVTTIIKRFEDLKIVVAYNTQINWRKIDRPEVVSAMIDVKVSPKRDVGFDEIAERIYRFPEVKSVYLMSGAYDLSVVVEGHSLSQVGSFVSERLSTLDSVLSTTTHFVMKKYKHDGVIFDDHDKDKRIVVSP